MRNKFLGTGEGGYHPIRKFKVILSGIRYAVLYDLAVAYKLVLSVLVLGACFYLRQWLDFGLVLLATGSMVASEMFNTAIEAMCDFVEPEHNEKIGIIKDVAAAAVGISILVWAIIVGIEAVKCFHHLKQG